MVLELEPVRVSSREGGPFPGLECTDLRTGRSCSLPLKRQTLVGRH